MGVLLMLMTIGGLIAAAILFVVAVITKNAWLKKFVLGGVSVWLVFYVIMLVGFSLASTEKTLAFNEPKEFCGFYLDCHMHTSVTGVRKAKTIGDRTANGEFYIVKVKVFSDAKRATLGLAAVDARVIDAGGSTYARDTRAEAQLGEQPSFDKKISPIESFERQIVFDLPADVSHPRLDITAGSGIEAVLIDDEDSILHKRSLFQLSEQNQLAGASGG